MNQEMIEEIKQPRAELDLNFKGLEKKYQKQIKSVFDSYSEYVITRNSPNKKKF